MLQDEHCVTLTEATKALPRIDGKTVHTSTIWRWARKGISGVRLETRRIGSRFVTSVEALDRFTKALAEIELSDRPSQRRPPGIRQTSIQREAIIARAEAESSEAGI